MSFDEGQYENSECFKCLECNGVVTLELTSPTDSNEKQWICDSCDLGLSY